MASHTTSFSPLSFSTVQREKVGRQEFARVYCLLARFNTAGLAKHEAPKKFQQKAPPGKGTSQDGLIWDVPENSIKPLLETPEVNRSATNIAWRIRLVVAVHVMGKAQIRRIREFWLFDTTQKKANRFQIMKQQTIIISSISDAKGQGLDKQPQCKTLEASARARSPWEKCF